MVSGVNSISIYASTDIHKPTPSAVPSTQNVLVNIIGFEEQENIQINTEPKLNGVGSYFIGYHAGEKEVSFEINVPTDFQTIYRNIRNASLNPVGNKCAIYLDTVNDDGTLILSESLTDGFIKPVRSTDLTNINKNWGTISITTLFTDPTIHSS